MAKADAARPDTTATDAAVAAGPAEQDGQLLLLPSFTENFLDYHAGRVISDPQVAIVELVANSWDAGADRVEITWPRGLGEVLSVADSGTGMTLEEFQKRWPTLNYNRADSQGSVVEFPSGVQSRSRMAFGRSGIGRHAMFCFANEYFVETRKAGRMVKFRVCRRSGQSPFGFELVQKGDVSDHGTRVFTTVQTAVISPDTVAELIGSRFVADPDFGILVNGEPVTLTDLEHLCERYEVPIEGSDSVVIRRFDSERGDRTSKQHGVAWWVNHRLVGNPSWEVYDRPLLDARTATAKRFTYVVEADALAPAVRSDWSGFHASEEVDRVRKRVSEFVSNDLRGVTQDIRKDRKRAALSENRHAIKSLPPLSQEQIATFAEEVQVRCPTIAERDLNNAVSVLAGLEKARSQYSLLEKLATLKPHDLDTLDQILEEWSVSDIKRVLGELRYRLDLIAQLEKLVDDAHADELHDLQPLFERGLWMFGPEFESINFISNRTLAKVVETFFESAALTTPRKRPDFVVLADSSIGVYSCDAFDERHEVSGYSAVVVVELKKGGFEVSHDQKDQALKYARELRRSGKVGQSTKMVCYVLGASVDPQAEKPTQEGETTVWPRAYSVLLRQAHARTFNLLRKVEGAKKWRSQDEELNAILQEGELPLFDQG
jgi:hypothetical protein